MAIDAYEIFLKNFNINEDEFINHGIKQVRIIPNAIVISEWEKLKSHILNGTGKVHIRSFGVKGQNSHLFLELYVDHFTKAKLAIDKSNNQKAANRIYSLLKHNKQYKTPNDNTLFNYQASHVFSKTKNPFCFLAPWNIVLLPKIYDPLTGHEAKGKLVDKFTRALQTEIFNRFSLQIEDFNKLMDQHAEELLCKFERKNKNLDNFDKHLISLKQELAKISI